MEYQIFLTGDYKETRTKGRNVFCPLMVHKYLAQTSRHYLLWLFSPPLKLRGWAKF